MIAGQKEIKEKWRKLWKANWNNRELMAGDIGGFTEWFFMQGVQVGKQESFGKLRNDDAKDYAKEITRLKKENRRLKESLAIACSHKLVRQLIKSVKSFKKNEI